MEESDSTDILYSIISLLCQGVGEGEGENKCQNFAIFYFLKLFVSSITENYFSTFLYSRFMLSRFCQ